MENEKRLLRERAVCVIIPTYNNHDTIRKVVDDALTYCDDVIVVNDGSTDGTKDILDTISAIQIVSYETNRGKGYALKKGFMYARDKGYAYAITIDADGQFYARDILNFLKANQQHPGALIIGQRIFKGAERTRGSKFANGFSNFWFCIQTGRKFKDTQTGYRLYPIKKLKGVSLLTSKYEAELELLVFSSWHGIEIVPIDVDVYYPPKEERISHFRPATDFFRISLLNTVLCFLAVVYGLPLRFCRFMMKWIRTVYAAVFFAFFSLLVFSPWAWILSHLGGMTERKHHRIHKLIYKASRFIMIWHGIPGVKFKYDISPGVSFDKPRVVICNHQSHIDLTCQLIFTPNIIFLTNKKVWNSLFYGQIIRNAEFLPTGDDIETLLPKLRALVDKGYNIALYPEGTRSLNGRIGRFHKGAFYIAQQLGLDILPMFLYGTGKVLKKKTRHLNKGQVYVMVDKPIIREKLKEVGDLQKQASMMHKYYVERYECLANKIEQNA